MGKLINGKVRFSARPQPFIEMSDKFYFNGQGYSKYSLSPIKNDFLELSTNTTVFNASQNLPIASSVLNMNFDMSGNGYNAYNPLGSDNMIVTDCVDANVEYILKNPLSGSLYLVKYDRKRNKSFVSGSISMNSRRASIIGQNRDYVFVLVRYSSRLQFCRIHKETLTQSYATGDYFYSIWGEAWSVERKLYEDEDIIVIGCAGYKSSSTSYYRPSFVILSKTLNEMKVYTPKIEDNDFGYITMSPDVNALTGKCSNAIVDKNGNLDVYFLASRYGDSKYTSILIKLKINLETRSLSYEEYTPDDDFNISFLNEKTLASHSYCYLEVSRNADVDTLTIIDGYKNRNVSLENQAKTSSITTFKVDTYKHIANLVSCEDISLNNYMYYVIDVGVKTLAIVTSNSIVYCSKSDDNEPYKIMNNITLVDPSFVMKDMDNGLWSIGTDGSVYKLDGPKAKIEMYCRFEKDSYTYNDREINTKVIVGIKDYSTGKLLSSNVVLRLSNNCVFRSNESNIIHLKTSNTKDLELPVIIQAPGELAAYIDVDFMEE